MVDLVLEDDCGEAADGVADGLQVWHCSIFNHNLPAAGGSAQGPSSRLTVAFPSPEMSTLKFGHSIYHPKCPGDPIFSW